MRTIAAIIVALLSIGEKTLSICTNQYGSAPCKFVPSSPGKPPPCAKPGLTYCEHPTYYPGQVIEHLIQNWQFDYTTLLSSESPEEFNSYFVPPSSRLELKPIYGPPPPNSLHRFHHYQPGSMQVPIPPQSSFNNPGHTYVPPLPILHQNSTDGYLSGRPNFATKLENNDYSSFSLPHTEHTNNWWKRYARDVSKQRRDLLRQRRNIARDRLYVSNLNVTNHNRARRQTQSGEQLCQFRTQYIMPRAALNNKGNWMYIVNMPEVDNKYTQLVKSETCLSQECSGICGLPVGYSSRCEQKYAQKRLIALEGGGNQLYTDVFWFPSCCVCTVTKTNP